MMAFLEDCHAETHVVQIVGSSESSRTSADDSHLLTITLDIRAWLDETLLEGHLDDGALVFTVGGRLMVETVQYAGLLAEGRTDTTCELGEGVGTGKQLVSQFKVAFVQGVVPFGCFVAQRTSPVAEGYAAVHAA